MVVNVNVLSICCIFVCDKDIIIDELCVPAHPAFAPANANDALRISLECSPRGGGLLTPYIILQNTAYNTRISDTYVCDTYHMCL